ncbi:MAG: hypothetical protein ACWGQW_02810 [bacterium]
MPLYIVVRDNEFFKRGEYVEDVELGHVQAHQMVKTEDGAWRPMYEKGFAVPKDKVKDCLLQIQNKGVDLDGVRRCR